MSQNSHISIFSKPNTPSFGSPNYRASTATFAPSSPVYGQKNFSASSIGPNSGYGNSPIGLGMSQSSVFSGPSAGQSNFGFQQNHTNISSYSNNFITVPENPWKELPFSRAIRVNQNEVSFTKQNGRHLPFYVMSVAYQEPYRKTSINTNEIRTFSYLQKAGLLQQYLAAGYARETINSMQKDNQIQVFFPSQQYSQSSNPYFAGGLGNTMQNSGGNQGFSGSFGGNNVFNRQTGIFPAQNTQSKCIFPTQNQGIFSNQSNGIFPAQNKGIFGTQNQGIFSLPSANNFPPQSPGIFQQGGIFNPQSNTGIFNQQQPQPFPSIGQPFIRSYNPQVVQGMHKPIMEEMGRLLVQEKMLPLYRNFFAKYGLYEDIFEYLLRKGMSIDQIQEFLAQRMLLHQIEKERARRMPSTSYYDPSSLSPGVFPHYSRSEDQPDRFQKYVDCVLERQKLNWQESLFRESCNNSPKEDETLQMGRMKRRRELIEELEQMQSGKFKEEEIRNHGAIGLEDNEKETEKNTCFKRRESNGFSFDL